jgi:mono/diheme cytochrome c family protein
VTTRVRARARRQQPSVVACAALSVLVLCAAGDAAAFAPDVNYALHCQGCHLADGRATPGLVPALDGAIGRFMRVREGREYLIRLPNVAATQLDDADTAALLNWLVRRFGASELPADFAPYTAAEIGAGRHRPLIDVEGARRNVLLLLGEKPG